MTEITRTEVPIKLLAIKFMWICPNCKLSNTIEDVKQCVMCEKCGKIYQCKVVW